MSARRKSSVFEADDLLLKSFGSSMMAMDSGNWFQSCNVLDINVNLEQSFDTGVQCWLGCEIFW